MIYMFYCANCHKETAHTRRRSGLWEIYRCKICKIGEHWFKVK